MYSTEVFCVALKPDEIMCFNVSRMLLTNVRRHIKVYEERSHELLKCTEFSREEKINHEKALIMSKLHTNDSAKKEKKLI